MKRFPKPAHALAHHQIAHPHFAQVYVHVGKHRVKHGLGQGGAALIGIAPQAADQQRGMQMDKVKPAFHRIAHRKIGVEIGRPRGGDSGTIKREARPFMR